MLHCDRFALPSVASLLFWLSLFAPRAVAKEPDLVDIKSVDSSIIVELRYAGENNIARRRLYPSHMKALVRPSMAQQLAGAQRFLRRYDRGLKIWDAYRPADAQAVLWDLAPDDHHVANPHRGVGSLHAWGVAVDATIVDSFGRDLSMPTDFDDFSPAAMLRYTGKDRMVRFNLRLLQIAMAKNDFYGLRTEWWHFTTKQWRKYVPQRAAKSVATEMKQMNGGPEKTPDQ